MSSRWALALAFACVALPAANVTADEVDELFTKGQKAYEEGRFNDAERNWEAAFAKKQSADLAANLAQAEIKIGQNREAANHLSYALRFLPATAPTEVRAEMQAELAKLEKSLGRIRVEVNLEGATVKVAGAVVGKSPLPDPIYVEPGPVEVTTELAGHDPTKQTVQAPAASPEAVLSKHELRLTGSGGPDDGRPIWPAVVLGVGGGLFVAGGLSGLAGAYVVYGNLEDRIAGKTCSTDPQCTENESTLDDANILGAVGFVGLGVGVAALTGMVLYLALPGDEPSSVGLRINGNGLSIEGSF